MSSLDNYNLIEEEHNSPRDMLLIDLFFIFAEKDLFHLNWYIFSRAISRAISPLCLGQLCDGWFLATEKDFAFIPGDQYMTRHSRDRLGPAPVSFKSHSRWINVKKIKGNF